MPLTCEEYLAIIERGLPPRTGAPRRVIVVGAGMAGLVAAYELRRAGHEPVILEARARVGGRICTLREPFSPGLYADVGAMRIPRCHTLTMAYVRKFALPVADFRLHNPRAYYYLHGQRHRIADVEADPVRLGFAVLPPEQGRTVGALWEQTLARLRRDLGQMSDDEMERRLVRYDGYSVRALLLEQGWSAAAIEMFGLLQNQESLMNSSALELLREELGGYYRDLVQIPGGMDQLPNAFLPALQERIHFGARLMAVDQTPDGATAHYSVLGAPRQLRGDAVILTLPFAALRHVEMLQPLSRGKQQAIRELHYDSAGKIVLQCRRRFWEEDEGIQGGWTVTDLPIRNVFYPSYPQEGRRGILLASYTWAEDARRWLALPPGERVTRAMENVARIHPQIRQEAEGGTSKIWDEDPFAAGAFALFDPGQQSLLYEQIIAPEGRLYFAGEHASLTHGWIQGAIESGLRAAWQVHHATL